MAEHEDGVVFTVAYGTSRKLDRMVPGKFAIRKVENEAAYELAGLSYDTKFDLRNRVELPWNDGFFAVPPSPARGQTPKLGSLHIALMRSLRATRRFDDSGEGLGVGSPNCNYRQEFSSLALRFPHE